MCDVGLPSNAPFEVDPFALNFKQHVIKGRLCERFVLEASLYLPTHSLLSIVCTPLECQEMVNLHAKSQARTHIGKVHQLEQINELVAAYKTGDVKGRCCITFE